MFFLGVSKSLKRATKKLPSLRHVYFVTANHFQKGGPALIVKERVARGQMKPDAKQSPIVQSLQEVYENIQGYSPGKFLINRTPKGLYIYGSVGAGKTMLMDIFYKSVKTKWKRRSHFNNFMADVHSRIHRLKSRTKGSSIWRGKTPTDPIKPVARDLVKEAWLLCFDEFQVTDIGDAMILKSLFTEMFENGMVMVATSNRAPEDLYKNGLQRTNFLPFIPILKKYCNVVNVSGMDYRTSTSDGIDNHYLLSGAPGTKSAMEAAFIKFCSLEKSAPGPKTLTTLGHDIVLEKTCGRVLFVSFKELCERPLSAADYIEIAKHFDVVIIKDVPKMDMNTRNEARRFILLIDTLYDQGIKLKMSAAAPPKGLFSSLSDSPTKDDHQQRLIMDDLGIEKGSENSKSSLFSGSEEVFAFKRTVSRITEMCSNSYWRRHQ